MGCLRRSPSPTCAGPVPARSRCRRRGRRSPPSPEGPDSPQRRRGRRDKGENKNDNGFARLLQNFLFLHVLCASAVNRSRHASLWRRGDFLKLWTAETISVVGSQVTLLALPLTAALSLQATP